MNPQPTIFISSIISEFYDLRGALKYFLGKNGFRVLMSEEPDFGADCEKDSLDNCKERIDVSDYYFLIIGSKPGFEFSLLDGTKTTVTFEEFKHFIQLKKEGKKINLIAFVRKQAWDLYTKKDFDNMPHIQHQFIDELVNNSLLDSKLGRWRYTFDKFNDIISILETNQNGLFIDLSRKNHIYKTYIKREIFDIYKLFLLKNDTQPLVSYIEFFDLPQLDHLDTIEKSKIEKEKAVKIVVFIISLSKKTALLRKINRVFNYIAQGEFGRFDPINEKYEFPEYIKLTIQALEILEGILENNINIEDALNEIKLRDVNDFYINYLEYELIRSSYSNLAIVIKKLANLILCFNENWTDLEAKDDGFYAYRGSLNNFSDNEAYEYAKKQLL